MDRAQYADDGLSIPKITDPLGRHWEQPACEEIQIDQLHALMSERSFAALHDYTGSQPSGVYSGKMWKAKYGNLWFLCWFGKPSSPESVWTFCREILIA